MVIAIIAGLAALLLPALAGAKEKAGQTRCLNNLKQLSLCSQMYSADNSGRLVENEPAGEGDASWVNGRMKNPKEATDPAFIEQGKLFPYAGQTAVYHCPSDSSSVGGIPRTRSYSMNGWMGSRYMERLAGSSGFRTFIKENELAAVHPSQLWLLAGESERTIDDGWFLVTMDDSKPFASTPANRHGGVYCLSFADGHVERYKWLNPEGAMTGSQGEHRHVSPENADWIRLKQVTTTR